MYLRVDLYMNTHVHQYTYMYTKQRIKQAHYEVGVAFFGEGAASEGDFAVAL